MSRSRLDVEATDCFDCNSMLEWEGDLPDNDEDIVCHSCEVLRLEVELARLKRIEEAAHKAIAILTARTTVALPPSAMMLAYKLAFDELQDGLRTTQARTK